MKQDKKNLLIVSETNHSLEKKVKSTKNLKLKKIYKTQKSREKTIGA